MTPLWERGGCSRVSRRTMHIGHRQHTHPQACAPQHTHACTYCVSRGLRSYFPSSNELYVVKLQGICAFYHVSYTSLMNCVIRKVYRQESYQGLALDHKYV